MVCLSGDMQPFAPSLRFRVVQCSVYVQTYHFAPILNQTHFHGIGLTMDLPVLGKGQTLIYSIFINRPGWRRPEGSGCECHTPACELPYNPIRGDRSTSPGWMPIIAQRWSHGTRGKAQPQSRPRAMNSLRPET